MYLLDDQNAIVDAEFSLDLFRGQQCIVIESSGGANPGRGVRRRNPDYNKLLNLVLVRLAHAGIKVALVVLDSSKVSDLPVEARIAKLDRPYPIDLSKVEIEGFRRTIQREIASMHRHPTAHSGGNGQKRIRICLDKSISADRLATASYSAVSAGQLEEYAPALNETEREYLRSARVGQGQFRKDLLEAYACTCPITGISNPELLIASHIKPWKACSNAERLDPQNGILLSVLIDRLFDRGLITFDEGGSIIASPALSLADLSKCGLERPGRIQYFERTSNYMQYHRTVEFRKVASP